MGGNYSTSVRAGLFPFHSVSVCLQASVDKILTPSFSSSCIGDSAERFSLFLMRVGQLESCTMLTF